MRQAVITETENGLIRVFYSVIDADDAFTTSEVVYKGRSFEEALAVLNDRFMGNA